MNWIPTSERLPGDKQGVLFVLAFRPFFTRSRVCMGHREPIHWGPVWIGVADTDTDDGADEYKDSDVTHWMPIPEPP